LPQFRNFVSRQPFHRRMIRLAVVSVLALAALAGQAQARSMVLPATGSDDVTGPVFSGPRVVWLKRANATTLTVEGSDPQGQRFRAATVKVVPTYGYVSANLLGAPGRIVVERSETRCGFDWRDCSLVLYDALLGPPEGPLTRLAGCAEQTCAEQCNADGFALTESAIAISSPSVDHSCLPNKTVVREFATGAFRALDDASVSDLNGDLIAFQDASWKTHVVNWRTGEEPAGYRVAGSVNEGVASIAHGVGVDPGNGLVYQREQADGTGSQLFYSTPSEPFDHALPLRGYGIQTVARAGVIAFADGVRVGVVSRAGDLRATTAYLGANRVALDDAGQRIAWATTPCGTALVAVWDLAQAAPPVPRRCALPARIGRTALMGEDRDCDLEGDCEDRYRVRLTCPARPMQGCSGRIELTGRRRRMLGRGGYHLPAGTRRFISFPAVGRTHRARGRARLAVYAVGTRGGRVASVTLGRR
jgi:hypothetical protein